MPWVTCHHCGEKFFGATARKRAHEECERKHGRQLVREYRLKLKTKHHDQS